jgi:hypothetical protein
MPHTQPGDTPNTLRGRSASLHRTDDTGKPLPDSIPIPVTIAEPTVNAPLSNRLRLALMTPSFRALVLYSYQRDALRALEQDARTLVTLGFEPLMTVNTAVGRIKLANGSFILYIGGEGRYLERRVRGMAVDHLDHGELLPEFERTMIVRPR